MTSERRRFALDDAVDRVVLQPPMDEWRLLVTTSHNAVHRVASAIVARAERHLELPFVRVQDQPDADAFLRTLKAHPHHALIFSAHPSPSRAFWQKLDKVRPRLRRAAPTILVLTEAAEVDLRICASHLSSWLSGRCLYIDEVDDDSDATLEALHDGLLQLLPVQFEELVFRLGLQSAYLSGDHAPRAKRSMELLALAGQQRKLATLRQLLHAYGILLR